MSTAGTQIVEGREGTTLRAAAELEWRRRQWRSPELGNEPVKSSSSSSSTDNLFIFNPTFIPRLVDLSKYNLKLL